MSIYHPNSYPTIFPTPLIAGTMLYGRGAELTWNGQRGVEGEYQRAINRMARSTLGAFKSTPLGILAGESGHTPARPLLDYRQTRFAHRLLARPQGGGGPEEILEREEGAVVRRLRAAAGTKAGETVEPQSREEGRVFPGGFTIDDQGPAKETAQNWRRTGTVWTDGSRLDSGAVGSVCMADRGGVDRETFPSGNKQGGI